MAAAALAMIVANSGAAPVYFDLLERKLGALTVHHWINDGLMAWFFLLVGLEIKREFVDGHLGSWHDRGLPIVAATGGMAVPALIFLGIAGAMPGLARGWAIPSATDIAFAIGVIALLRARVPTSLKLLLTTIAIVDDLGAVLIIALAYTASISGPALLAAAGVMGVLFGLNRFGCERLWPYLLGFLLLWIAVLLSGVHATVAGVLAATAIPIRRSPGAPDVADSPLHRLEDRLHPWVAYAIVPLFGFANAGLSLAGIGPAQLLAPLPLGIAAGLFLGKQLGVFASLRIAVRLGLGTRPFAATWLQVYGMALLCGIGFTMSLFIGGLAFADPLLADEVKLGVLMGSLASAGAGYTLLRLAPARKREGPPQRPLTGTSTQPHSP